MHCGLQQLAPPVGSLIHNRTEEITGGCFQSVSSSPFNSWRILWQSCEHRLSTREDMFADVFRQKTRFSFRLRLESGWGRNNMFSCDGPYKDRPTNVCVTVCCQQMQWWLMLHTHTHTHHLSDRQPESHGRAKLCAARQAALPAFLRPMEMWRREEAQLHNLWSMGFVTSPWSWRQDVRIGAQKPRRTQRVRVLFLIRAMIFDSVSAGAQSSESCVGVWNVDSRTTSRLSRTMSIEGTSTWVDHFSVVLSFPF